MSTSLQLATGFVHDALSIAPTLFYRAEDIRLGEYTFVPWVRSGLAAVVQNPAPGTLRATVTVSVTVQDDKGGSRPVDKTLTLRGPGDVIGIDVSQIVRRHPTPGTTDAEETFMAHVEFDRPEFPWLFTPFAPRDPDQGRLDPWLVLVVLEVGRASFEPSPAGMPGRVRTRKGELQPLEDAWAFAHAQVLGNSVAGAAVSDRLTANHGPANLSRLLCPRRLKDGRAYVACLVPAYDCGVKAGLGLGGGTLNKAWTRTAGDDDEEIVLPVYDQWSFATAPDGDFEHLAKKLLPIRAPWSVGRRIIDVSKPRGGLPALAADEPGQTQVLRCALFSPAPPPAGSPPEGSVWNLAKRRELLAALNRPAEAAGKTGVADADLPRVGPRIYARFQRGQGRVNQAGDTDWFEQLNTTPPHRIVAGLGTRVVQKDQEQLMQGAWAQVGAIDKANRALVLMQYARYLGASMHRQHFAKLALGSLSQLTRGLQGKIRLGGSAFTVAGAVTRSMVAPAALSGAFRRATRTQGPLARHLAAGGTARLGTLVAQGDTFRDFRRTRTELDGVKAYSPAALKNFSPELVGRALGVPPQTALDTLRDRVTALNSKGTVADQFLSPRATWNVPAGNIDLARIGGQRLLATLQKAMPARPASELARAEAIGSLLSGIAKSGIPEISASAGLLVTKLNSGLPAVAAPVVTPAPGGGAGGVLAPGGVRPGIVRPGAIVAGPLITGPRLTGPQRISGVGAVRHNAVREQPLASREQPLATRSELLVAGVAIPRARFETVAAGLVTADLMEFRNVKIDGVATALAEIAQGVGVSALPLLPDRTAPAIDRATLLTAIDPGDTITRYARGRLGNLPGWLPSDWFKDRRVQPIMAAPEFKRPMYEALDGYDRDWLVPGLGSMPQTDFVTLLETNPAFTDAFLIGLSDEMGRELLWRGYPTDQRGTYFKRFWDDARDELARPIHTFPPTPLGTHIESSGGTDGRIVMVIRGALVRRYPDAIVMALHQLPPLTEKPPKFQNPADGARILFHAQLPPDIILVGFDLTVPQVLAGGWWFIIAEHPTAPRFGLDVEDAAPPKPFEPRNEFDWDDVEILPARGGGFLRTGGPAFRIRELTADPGPREVAWPPASSAVVARVLLQSPVRAAFDGAKLITPAVGGP